MLKEAVHGPFFSMTCRASLPVTQVVCHISMDESFWQQVPEVNSGKRGDRQEAERSKQRSSEQHWVTERRAPSFSLMCVDRGVM